MERRELSKKVLTYTQNVKKFFEDYVLVELPDNVPSWVAGGALRDYFLYGYIKSETDIDVFTDSQESFDKIRECLLESYDEKIETDYAVTFFNKEDSEKVLQLIKLFYKDQEDSIVSFDFTCCCASVGRNPYTSSSGVVENDVLPIVNFETNEFFDDCYNKHIRIVNLNKNPAQTLKRLKSYVDKGFTVSDSEKICLVNCYMKEEYNLEEYAEDPYSGILTLK